MKRKPRVSPNGRITYFLDSDPHVVYRAYGPNDELLYIGMTCNLKARMRHHREYSVWTRYAVYLTEEWLPSRGDAYAAERLAILAENPKYNIARW